MERNSNKKLSVPLKERIKTNLEFKISVSI